MLHSQSIELAHVLAAEVLEQIPAHQFLAERNQNPLLHLLAADGQAIRAGAAGARAETREAIAPIHHVPAAATQRTSSGRRRHTSGVAPD